MDAKTAQARVDMLLALARTEALFGDGVEAVKIFTRAVKVVRVDDAQPIDVERLVRTCPNCDGSLIDRGCKLRCTCGYFVDCETYE